MTESKKLCELWVIWITNCMNHSFAYKLSYLHLIYKIQMCQIRQACPKYEFMNHLALDCFSVLSLWVGLFFFWSGWWIFGGTSAESCNRSPWICSAFHAFLRFFFLGIFLYMFRIWPFMCLCFREDYNMRPRSCVAPHVFFFVSLFCGHSSICYHCRN